MDNFGFILALISLAIGAAVLLLLAAIRAAVRGEEPKRRRLETLAQESAGRRGGPRPALSLRQRLLYVVRAMAPKSERGKGWEKSKLRQDLITAGFRSADALNIFTGVRLASVFLLPATTFAVGVFMQAKRPTMLMVTAGAAVLAYILPGYVLEKLAAHRSGLIARQMPSMLDLLVIAVESGLGLDAAVQRVSRDLATSSPILAQELAIFSLELKLGSSRVDALHNLAKRCGVDEMASLVAMLIQADRFGVSVGRSIRVFADDMRTKRRQKLEEQAAKIPLKLLFPVLFLIFPAIMAVMAGPAIINIMEKLF